MLFDGHGDVWTDVTCKRVDHNETDIYLKISSEKIPGRQGNRRYLCHLDRPSVRPGSTGSLQTDRRKHQSRDD